MTKDATHAISGEIWGRRQLSQHGNESPGTVARIEKLIQQTKKNDVAGAPCDLQPKGEKKPMNTHLITRAQFDLVRPLLEGARKATRPRINDLYEILCAILYREANGTTWRGLPDVFPPWRSVHEYHAIWTRTVTEGDSTVLEQVRAALVNAGHIPAKRALVPLPGQNVPT